MTSRISAIETSYNGCHFRSRLEARWAVFLDSFGEKWIYEHQGYRLQSGNYLPDFFLPRLECWLEIKGEKPSAQEINLCTELSVETDKAVVLAWGLPFAPFRKKRRHIDGVVETERLWTYCYDSKDSSAGEGWWCECFWAIDRKYQFCICSNDDFDRAFTAPGANYGNFSGMKQISEIFGPIGEDHVSLAKSARFEFDSKTKPYKDGDALRITYIDLEMMK